MSKQLDTETRSLRYTIGQDYPFVHCKFTRSFKTSKGETIVSRPSSLGLYCPWNEEHTLLDISVVMLKCMSHAKVAWDQDPKGEKKYDGFTFSELPISLDPPSRRWFNQYPTASYGQLSTDADRYVHLDWEGCGMSAKEAIAYEEGPTNRFEMHDGCHFLANLRRGQVTIAKATNGWEPDEKKQAIEALVAFEQRVHKLMEEAVGKKLKILQVMYERTPDGGEPILMDWFEVVFEDEPEFAHTKWEDGRGQKRLVTPVETEA
jgi:hypothetical protein